MSNFLNRFKSAFLALSLSILCGSLLFADQVAVQSFKYLNSNENSTIIDPAEAQDLLNVDVTPGGKSVKKRPGYGTYKSLATFQPPHGGYHFFDSTGNDVQLWGSSTTLKSIVADAAPTVLITSATAASTWDCTDSQGSAYCENSNRDGLIKTNGATLQLWQATPAGSMVEMTPDRLAVSGVVATPNTIYHSQANTFTNFTVGPLNSDAFTEVIAAAGSKITHIRWACGKLLWWKDQSFGYEDFDDQYSLSIKIVSDTIGTFDNTSAMDPGGNVWFRGQDGHIWKYDCSSLSKESIDITPQIQTSGRRTSNSVTYDTQADFQTGSSSGTNSLSTRILSGSVVPSSFTKTETSSASGWGSGSASNTSVGTSSISLTTDNAGDITNPDFESALSGNWYLSQAFTNSWVRAGSSALTCGTVNPQSGSNFLLAAIGGTSSHTADFQAITLDTTTLQTVSIPNSNDCTWRQLTLTPSASNIGKRVRFRFHINDSFNGDSYYTTSDSYIWGGAITFWYVAHSNPSANNGLLVDNVQKGSSTITTGSFASQAFNTGMPYSLIYASATWSVNTTTPSFVLQKSANGSTGWSDVSTSTGVNVQTNLAYLRYLSTFTVGGNDNALSSLQGVNILARSSGTWFSAVKNAPNFSAWSTYNPTWTDNGDDITFYTRSSTSPYYVQNSSPPWIAQPDNALVTNSTGSYLQVIASFTVTAATNTPSSFDAFTLNWFDGTATDQAYMLYFDNAIWTSVAYGTGVSSNTYVFKRDLINDGFTLYNFGVGGMLVQGNRLYFGDVSTGTVFLYGTGTSDNGSAINAYWRSKSFTGSDPFLDNNLTNIDTYAKQNSGQSLTATYTLNTSTSTNYTISLTSATQTIIQNRKLLPSGKNGYNWDFKFGDNTTTSAWEVFGFRIGYTSQPYRPSQ